MKTMLLPALLFAAACGGRASPICSADPAPADAAVLVEVELDAHVGAEPFALGKTMRSAAGTELTVSMLRFYTSRWEVVTEQGRAVPAVLADADGIPLEYGVALVDYATPASETLHLLVPPGRYTSVSFSIGVPEHCEDGGLLNHENASEQSAPLDVDTDMYWGWNPGYVFLKIEGRTTTAGGTRPFVFHVGDDKRYTTIAVPAALDVAGPARHRLALDVDRFFVTADGDLAPDPTGVTSSNNVHGGREADVLADNLVHSEVFQWVE
ncbi:MAG: hypothetical protein KIT31_26915 [Deltaproteobacteria bacterium]|nr:hypothetical protein [Deltaproteobacteria bacterium]